MLKLLRILLIITAMFLLTSAKPKDLLYEEISYDGLEWPVSASFVTGVDSDQFQLLKEYRDCERSIWRELKGVRCHPLYKDSQARATLAQNIVNAASMTAVPWEYMFSVVRYESTFFPSVIGNDGTGSIGLMQMHGVAWSYCAKEIGRKVDKSIPSDQLICGGVWLRYSIDSCGGDLSNGLAKYATGSLCGHKKVPVVVELVEKRMKLYYETVDKSSEI